MRHAGIERRNHCGDPSASLGISPADSNARRTAQLPLAVAPLRLRSGLLGLGQDDKVWAGIGEDDSNEEVRCSPPQRKILAF